METQPNPSRTSSRPTVLLGLAGAVAGGAVGSFAFGWLARQGFYALALPGVMLGLGASWLSRGCPKPLAIGCGVMALALGIFAEWKHFPFVKDNSFIYFVTHLLDLRPFTLLMLALGGLAGFWFSRKNSERLAPGTPPSPTASS